MPYVKQDNTQPKKELLEQYKTFSLAHQYNPQIKQWMFKGYMCNNCGRTVQNPNIVPKHHDNCKKKVESTYGREPEPEFIRDIKGNPWKPLDFNLN